MTKKTEKVKGYTVDLRLLITEKDLKKIKSATNAHKTKVFKQYSDLLLNCIKAMDISRDTNKEEKEANKVKEFNNLEDLESYNREG